MKHKRVSAALMILTAGGLLYGASPAKAEVFEGWDIEFNYHIGSGRSYPEHYRDAPPPPPPPHHRPPMPHEHRMFAPPHHHPGPMPHRMPPQKMPGREPGGRGGPRH